MKTNKITLTFLFLWLTVVCTYAQKRDALQQKWDEESAVHDNPLVPYKASPLPDRILLIAGHSNHGELTITWRTDTTVQEGIVEFEKANGLTFEDAKTLKTKSTTTLVRHKDYAMLYHKAVIRNLQPDVTYQYRVGNSPHWSKWTLLRQRSDIDTLNLLYFGDAQNGIYDHASKLYDQAFREFPDTDLSIHIGDMINHANNDYEWAEWHAATASMNRTIPLIATPGNHEYLKNLNGKKVQLSDYWNSTFPFPYTWEQGPYYLEYEFVRFVVLNSNTALDRQTKWLDSILTDTKQEWVVLVSHHPVFSGAKDRQNKGLLENWLPVIEKHKERIGLVLQGHDHTYARGGLESRSSDKDKPSHPVFTVAVSGDKYYPLLRQSWMDVSYDRTSSFQAISITRNKIIYKAYSETNELIDQFEVNR